uniref:ATP synthase subunit e, mitochondrial n=1 Tax=Steinernema glaseri TaxID=37863 RepID=A0A1I8A533_9BILA
MNFLSCGPLFGAVAFLFDEKSLSNFEINTQMAVPRWWPYRASPEDALKKLGVLVLGVIVGAKVINHYYKPLEEYERELEKGKAELLRKYKQIHQERIEKYQR